MDGRDKAINVKERSILRNLAHRVAEIAALPEQLEKARLWTVCNDLNSERAMVYADPQGGWNELDAAWLSLECEGQLARDVESSLKRTIIRHEHIPDDFPIMATLHCPLKVTGDGYNSYGVTLQRTDSVLHKGAYHIEPVIKCEADLGRLHFRPIKIDHEVSDHLYEQTREVIGDILHVEKPGRSSWRYGLTRVLIHMRGLEQMMIDMYDNPGLLHQLLGFLRDDFLREIDVYEQEHAIRLNNRFDSVTGSGGLCPTKQLPQPDYTDTPRTKDCICWGESQETVLVGPAQFDEFVLSYQLPLLAKFGLVDYGCCEPLDHKLDLLIARVPHLRWVSVSPWANRELVADKLRGNYVYVYKPNPSFICSPQPDWRGAEREVKETLEITRGCPVHVVMKDTHTFCGEPDRITRWSEMAVRMAEEIT